jgi:hypothetical protein
MYVNEKMIPTETTQELGAGDGGGSEFKYDIFDIL